MACLQSFCLEFQAVPDNLNSNRDWKKLSEAEDKTQKSTKSNLNCQALKTVESRWEYKGGDTVTCQFEV